MAPEACGAAPAGSLGLVQGLQCPNANRQAERDSRSSEYSRQMRERGELRLLRCAQRAKFFERY